MLESKRVELSLVLPNKRKRNEIMEQRFLTERQTAMAEQYFQNGNLYLDKAQYQDAIACYSQAINELPERAKFYIQRAHAYYALKDITHAKLDCFKTCCLDPHQAKLAELLHLLISEEFKERSKLDVALSLFSQFFEANEQSAIFYQLGAKIFFNRVTELEQVTLDDTSIHAGNYGLLHIAALLGRIEIAKLLLKKGLTADGNHEKINRGYGAGLMPLVLAARHGQLAMIKYLVKMGADVNQQFGKPLAAAIKSGQLTTVQYLIEQKANLHRAATYGGMPPLHLAVTNGHLAIVDYLLQRKEVDINEVEPYDGGCTPLHIAVDNNDFAMMTFLLERGADLKVVHHDGWTPVCFAIESGRLDIVMHLLKFSSDTDFKGKLVAVAASHNKLDIVKYLIEQGADINYSLDSDDSFDEEEDENHLEIEETPLIAAILNNSTSFALAKLSIEEVVSLKNLVANSCKPLQQLDINAVDYKEVSFTKDEVASMQLALAAIASDVAKNLNGKLINNFAIEKYLLAKGADVTKTDNSGETALDYCIHKGYMELAKLLIIYGALREGQQFGLSPVTKTETPLNMAAATSEMTTQIENWYKDRFFLANQWKIKQAGPTFFKSHQSTVVSKFAESYQDCTICCTR